MNNWYRKVTCSVVGGVAAGAFMMKTSMIVEEGSSFVESYGGTVRLGLTGTAEMVSGLGTVRIGVDPTV